ncbi:MAG: hypothetical protein M3162_06980 [Thermoproteota archaeon]|nr:hypothetical protein [Thermoproteota archaeon]
MNDDDKPIEYPFAGEIITASRLFKLEYHANLQGLSRSDSGNPEDMQNGSDTSFVDDNDPADYYF